MEDGSEEEAVQGRRSLRSMALLIAAMIVIGILLGAAIAKLLESNDEDEEAEGQVPASARIVNIAELREAAAKRGSPIYWVGKQPNTKLELSEASGDGEIYVRYLDVNAKVGEGANEFLTVGTYSLPDPQASLAAFAKSEGEGLGKLPSGGVYLVNPQRRTNIYIVKPDSAYELEVFDPDPRRALKLALGRQLAPVKPGSASKSSAPGA